jgi:hypothetical protein
MGSVISPCMKISLPKDHRFAFFSAWLILTAIQAAFTQLQDDEAYYWVYSKFLDWGYFDHPPVTAVMIRAGCALLHNELGVRLIAVLMNLGSLLMIEKLIGRANPRIFYGIALSLAALQIAGFLSVPDTPLIFFTALFFLAYSRFLQRSSFANTVLLAISISLLLYSKYHGVLIVFFTLLSNLKLLKKYQAWIAAALAFIFFLPHLIWQYQHDWVSIRYHLFESNVNPYKISYTIDYIGGQLLLAGPIAGVILLPAAFLYKTKDLKEKALFFTMTGIYIFFFLSSFKGKVEANWTSPAIVPLMILSHRFLSEKINWEKWLFRLLPFTMLIVLCMRVIMIADIIPNKEIRKRYHAWKSWPAIMKAKTNGLPIVFDNSYQRASQYWFHTGQISYSLNAHQERRNNFNFWPIEDSILGKPVYLLDIYRLYRFQDSLKTPLGSIGYRYDPSFASFAKVQIDCLPTKITTAPGSAFTLRCTPLLTEKYRNFILENKNIETRVFLSLYNKYGWLRDIQLPFTVADIVSQQQNIECRFNIAKGDYYLRICLQAKDYEATHNSEKIEMTLK